MNLLVTNTRNTQAYAIIRALRPYARKIVATMEGENRLAARISHAANSRLVDKRYYTPFPAADWRAGNIKRENTYREEAYIQTVLHICESEQIDTIFPSFDPHVYVFSKNKERFAKNGILIPVPEYETVITPLDKYRTIRIADEVGFPCPKTYLPESQNDLRRIADELSFPLVVKPRFTSGGRGTLMVRGLCELLEKVQVTTDSTRVPMIQEYVPGRDKQQFYLTLDKKGELKLVFCPKTHRLFDRIHRSSSAASESSAPHPYADRATIFARKLGWWGGMSVQTKIDSRDGLPKLLEANPRLGHHLWYMTELGINVPLICLRIARGDDVEVVESYPERKMLLSPLEDLGVFLFSVCDVLIYNCKSRLGMNTLDPLNSPMSLREMLQSYKRTYLGTNEKVFDPYFKYCLQDPLVSFLWWLKYSYQVLAAAKHLGH